MTAAVPAAVPAPANPAASPNFAPVAMRRDPATNGATTPGFAVAGGVVWATAAAVARVVPEAGVAAPSGR